MKAYIVIPLITLGVLTADQDRSTLRDAEAETRYQQSDNSRGLMDLETF